jgi:acyl-CoA synthetase (AMP-forming)/AMP-acid ligase II
VGALCASATKPDRGITFLSLGSKSFLSYAELLQNARDRLGTLQALGLQRGDVVVMQLPELREHLAWLWAAILGCMPPVNIALPAKYEAGSAVVRKLLGVVEDLEARHVLAVQSNARSLRELLSPVAPQCVVHDVSSLLLQPGAEPQPPVAPEETCFYQLTSGSTGKSKVIPECHSAIIAHARHSAAHCNYSSLDVTLNWLPFDHVVPMLTYHMTDIYIGRSAVQVPTAEVIAWPLLWVEAMAAHRVTHSWAPNFGFKLVVEALAAASPETSRYDLSALRRLMNAGEQVTTEVCDAFLRGLSLSRSVMQPAFGMAEVSTCMTYNNEYDRVQAASVIKASTQEAALCLAPAGATGAEVIRFVDLGPVSPGVEMRIACDGGSHVRQELQVRHSSVAPPPALGTIAHSDAPLPS